MQKVQDKMIQAYLKARAEMLKLENEEDGLETVETVILVGVAVILAVIVFNVLTGGDTEKGEGGLIGEIFGKIRDQINKIFGE